MIKYDRLLHGFGVSITVPGIILKAMKFEAMLA